MKRGCVYIVYEAGNFRPALDLSTELKAAEQLNPVLFSPYYLPDTASYIAEARDRGIPYIHETTALGGDADPFGQLAEWGLTNETSDSARPDRAVSGRSLMDRIRLSLAGRLLRGREGSIRGWTGHYEARLSFSRRFLHAVNAGEVILPEDNVERDSSCWCSAAASRGGSTSVISYGSVTPHEAAIAYFDNSDYHAATAAARAFLTLYPSWGMVWNGRFLIRLPLERAYVMERMGLAPDRPWVINTGLADRVVVESDHMKALSARHGISIRKLAVLGNPAFDRLARGLAERAATRAQWLDRFGCDPAASVLLCAMPPDQYPGRPAPEFASYRDLVDGWLDELDGVRQSLFPMVSPHPNIAAGELEHMRARGFPVLEGGVAGSLPACDLYVASVSSTIKWARACGKPVLNYDCYDYGFEDYAGAQGIKTVMNRAGFATELARLSDPAQLLLASRETELDREFWGRLDGRSMARLVDHVQRAADSRSR